jgi:gluconokinase
VEKSKAALMIGTSARCASLLRAKFLPKFQAAYGVTDDRKRIIIGGALSDGGGLYGWLKDNFRLKEDDDKTEAEIEKRLPDAHNLTFLPFLRGRAKHRLQ